MHPLICGLLKIDASAVWDLWLGVADAESQHMYWSIPCYIEDLTHPRILVFMAADEGWILELIPLDTEGQLKHLGSQKLHVDFQLCVCVCVCVLQGVGEFGAPDLHVVQGQLYLFSRREQRTASGLLFHF